MFKKKQVEQPDEKTNERLPIQAENEKKRRTLKQNKWLQFIKGKAVRNTFFVFLGVFILGGYLFLFTSKMIIPNTTNYMFTPPGQVINFSTTRTVTLERWNYSPAQKLMEIIVTMENNDYNGKDEYQSNCVVTIGGKDYKATLTPIISEKNYYVMQIKNVPDNFGQATLQMKIKDDDQTPMVKLYTNRKEVKVVETITVNTKEQYMQEQAQDKIQQYETAIAGLQSSNQELQNQLTNIETTNKQLEEDKKYQTEKEITQTNQKIGRNLTEIKKLQETIKTNEGLMKENEQKIEKAKEKIEALN